MDNLKDKWRQAKTETTYLQQSSEELIKNAVKKKNSILYFHYGNIFILVITLIIVSLFFIYVAPLKTVLSKIGITLMISALLLRIIIEFLSALKSKKILFTKDAATTTLDSVAFYDYRKKIHGPVTIVTVALYAMGFYALSPEFSIYIARIWMISIHVSFLLGAFFLIWQIRKGIKKEMKNLSSLFQLREQILNEDDNK
jgi:hypothetical protein